MPKTKTHIKIPVFFIAFFDLEIIKDALDSLSPLSNQLEIIVIENRSEYTETLIKPYLIKALKDGLIKKYYLIDKNLANNAPEIILGKELSLIKSSDYFILTDGDIKTASNQWFNETTSILNSNKEVFACGIRLCKSNLPISTYPNATSWIPEPINITEQYIETPSGAHLCMYRSSSFLEFWKYMHVNNLCFLDSVVAQYCYNKLYMKWAVTKVNTGIHLTWNSYADLDHPYTKFRMSKSLEETWNTKNYYSKVWVFEKDKPVVSFYDWKRIIRKQLIPKMHQKLNSIIKHLKNHTQSAYK